MAYRRWLSVCLFILLQAVCHADTNDIDIWTDKAITLGLDKSRTWQVLGHYKPHANGWKSLISDTNFFLASSGNENPKAELIATIHALLDTNAAGHEADCVCRFPARALWLRNALSIPASRMPCLACKNNSDLMLRIAPCEAVLVFPGAAFKGLGAMFGHTLIRFDAKDQSPLISYSVSYGLLSINDNLISYIVKGLTGGFNGYYTLAPYYQKLHEYKDMEERDIWEYPLDLNPDEVNMMVLHSIELQKISSKYYFLDENCALNLLFIIEAGRPSLKLVEHYWNQPAFWVIPSDTVLFLWNEGILKRPEFQSSLSRQIDFFTQHYRKPIIDEAKRMADAKDLSSVSGSGELTQDEMETARELAAKIVQYRFAKLEITQEEFHDQYDALVQGNRSLLPQTIPSATPPHEGHPADRYEVAMGMLDTRQFLELGWRPAYHDWNDPPEGYPDLGKLNLLDLKVRYYPNQDDFKLQQAEIIGAGSLSPENSITKQNAWSFSSGLSQIYLQDDDQHLLFYLNGGAGKSYQVQESGNIYWLMKGSVLAGPALRENVDIGPEVEAGYSCMFGPKWQINMSGTTAYYGISEKSSLEQVDFTCSRYFSTKNAVSLNIGLSGIGWNRGIPEFYIRWQHYF
jgi:hypothetical protein